MRLHLVTVVGARPQFIKAAPMSRAVRAAGHDELLIHTGQHYDAGMSQVFFDELGIPPPDVNLEVGSGTHARQTAAMMTGIEEVLLARKPDALIVYGDTNSTVAGALVAAKLSTPIVHVEAGLRSYNRAMPEEINRVMTDHLASLLWTPSETAARNLAREGITEGVEVVGDIMADALASTVAVAERHATILERLELTPGRFVVATIHRADNTEPGQLPRILDALGAIGEPVIFPVHPRTRAVLASLGWTPPQQLRLVDPLGHVDMVALTRAARVVVTDSGGLQKEAYWLGVPCVTVRSETEWVETVANGWNVLVGSDPMAIVAAVRNASRPPERPVLYGDGATAGRCVASLERHLNAGRQGK